MKEKRPNQIAKSNRDGGDYFELRVCEEIARSGRFVFPDKLILDELRARLAAKPDGASRLATQERNLSQALPKIFLTLERETRIKGSTTGVSWVGRNHGGGKTVEDVVVFHFSGKTTRFSLKSIEKNGAGTIKNLGMRALRSQLGIDFTKEYEEMWQNLLGSGYFPGTTPTTQRAVKVFLNTFPESHPIRIFTRENGQKYQERLNTRVVEAFNRLSPEDRVQIVNSVTHAAGEEVYVVVSNGGGVAVSKTSGGKVTDADRIVAIKDTVVGFKILINGRPYLRAQTSCTNGIGMSAFCVRFFDAIE